MILAWALGLLGGFVCLLNFYLSFLRYPLFRLRGGRQEDWKWISGFPLVGSLFLAVAWFGWLRELDSVTLDVLAWTLVVLDTGGIHWFILCVSIDAISSHKGEDA